MHEKINNNHESDVPSTETNPSSIQEQLLREGIKCPPIKFRVILNRHVSASDYSIVENDFLQGDLLFPEIICDTDSKNINLGEEMISFSDLIQLASLKGIGRRDWEEFIDKQNMLSDYYKALCKSVYGIDKQIYFADISPKDPETLHFLEVLNMCYTNKDNTISDYAEQSSSISDFAEKAYALFKEFGELQHQREFDFYKRIREATLNSIRINKRLQTKYRIDISVLMGASHTGLYHLIRRSEPNTDRIWNSESFQDSASTSDLYPRFGMFDIEPDRDTKIYFALGWIIPCCVKNQEVTSIGTFKDELKLLCRSEVSEKLFKDYKKGIRFENFEELKYAYLK